MRPVIVLFASVVILACHVSAMGHHKLIRLILAKTIMKSRPRIPIPLPIPIVSHRKKHHTHVHEFHKFHGHHHHGHHHHGHHSHHDHHDHHDFHDHHDLHHDHHHHDFPETGFGHGFKGFGDVGFGGHDLETPIGDFGHHHESSLFDNAGLGDFDSSGHGKLDASLDLKTPLDASDSLSDLPADFGHLGGGHGDLLDAAPSFPMKDHMKAKKSSS